MDSKGVSERKFLRCLVVGAAVKGLGDILRPFIEDRSLLADLDAVTDPNGWYPVSLMRSLLDVAEQNNILTRTAENRAISTLRYLMSVPGLNTPKDVIVYITKSVPLHHKGDPGQYEMIDRGPQSIEIRDTTYLPCGFSIPMLKKIVAGFGGMKVTTQHSPQHCRQNGARKCKYTISWEDSSLVNLRSRNTSRAPRS